MAHVDRDITVTAQPDDKGGTTFTMSGEGVSGDGASGFQVEFDKGKTNGMKKTQHYAVKFTLVDKSGLNLRFVTPEINAMWAKVVPGLTGNSCPPANINPLKQFAAYDVSDTELFVLNKDKDKNI